MFKDNRYINAGQNEICRYGRKARERVEAFLEANDKGYYSFPVDGGKYWTIGTSDGKYGEFAKVGDTFFFCKQRRLYVRKGRFRQRC